MSECEKECVFNSNNECWLACKNKFYNQALEDFADEMLSVCAEYDSYILEIKKQLTK